MIAFRQIGIVLIVSAIAGCSLFRGDREDETLAAVEMQIADSLERVSAIHEAAAGYALVASRYPSSSFFHHAVRKAAFLHCSPRNEAVDDSASIYWFQVYARLPISMEEKEYAETMVSLLGRINELKKEHEAVSAVSGKQGVELASRKNRIRELETQLKDATDELKKLREIDVKAYRRGTRK